jgi:phospholipid-binding lipoprotein MlaA
MQAAGRHLEDALIMRTVSGPMIRGLLILFIAALFQGCATTGGHANADPWEGFNRGAFAFNESLDGHVVRPIARGYVSVTPSFVRAGVNNFFGNIADAWTSVNQLLQGKPHQAVSDMGRFILNTTVGVLGLWDVASAAGIEKHEEDFGQTLAVWGVPSGPYLVLPFFGPSSARDGPALLVNPVWTAYKDAFNSEPAYWATLGLDAVRIRANLLPADKVLDEAAIDKYAFIRDAWRQRRRSQVYDGNPPAEPED